MTTSISETKCGDVGLQREEHNQESKGWFQEDQMKRSMNSKPANKFKQCAKVGDELEMLLKGKEIFFDQANHKAWRRGRTAGSPFFGNGTGTNNNEKETEYGGARKKNACSTCLHNGKKVRSHSREPRSCESTVGEPNLAVEERARRRRTGWEREWCRWISNNSEPYFNSKAMSVCLSVLDLPKKNSEDLTIGNPRMPFAK